ncbi:MAG: hypothetical protein EXR75_05545 [Myxococcales bacterium]|nr:hypothetical protein [Myxococcales bacterium]
MNGAYGLADGLARDLGAAAHGTRPDVLVSVDSPRVVEPARAERRLESILRALMPSELDALILRVGVSIDASKRIDKASQAARAIVRSPELRDPSRLPAASAELLRRIAEAGGALVVGTVPVGLEVLVRRALVFARHATGAVSGVELMLPTALLVQLRGWDSEDPRSARALLSEASFEASSAIAAHYLGRPSTPPVALCLEAAWDVLGDPDALARELELLSHHERRLLEQLERVGCEVDAQELMDLEREPLRIRGAYGVASGRRGAVFSLEKRGFLFHAPPNRYIVPSEVGKIIGAARRRSLEGRRALIRSQVVLDDHLPRRATFSKDPTPTCLAMAMLARVDGLAEVRPGVGTPRSVITRLGQRCGRSPEETALLVALSRAAGLWDLTANSLALKPGSLAVRELGGLLFECWRAGAAWDEARPDPEVLRAPEDQRDASPVTSLRAVVIEALHELGELQWVGKLDLLAYIADDSRVIGARRVFARWAKRTGLPIPDERALAERVVFESLRALGALDVGGGENGHAGPAGSGLAIRVTVRGRSFLGGTESPHSPCSPQDLAYADDRSHTDGRVLKIGGDARVAAVLDLAPFVEVVALEPCLELELSPNAIRRGLASGVCIDEMHRRLAAVAPLSEAAARALIEAGTVIGHATFVAASAFLWIDDAEVLELLRARAAVGEQFVDPSPPGGLLVAAGVDLDRLARRCRALGVEIHGADGMMRARRSTIPPLPEVPAGTKRVSIVPESVRPQG